MNELNRNALMAFFDLRDNFENMVAYADKNGDFRLGISKSRGKHLEKVTKQVEKELDRQTHSHPHWGFAQNSKYAKLWDKVSPTFADQFLNDFKNNVNFIKFISKFYIGDLTQVKDNLDGGLLCGGTWSDYIHSMTTELYLSLGLIYSRRELKKEDLLLSQESVKQIRGELSRAIALEVVGVFKAKAEIEKELKEMETAALFQLEKKKAMKAAQKVSLSENSKVSLSYEEEVASVTSFEAKKLELEASKSVVKSDSSNLPPAVHEKENSSGENSDDEKEVAVDESESASDDIIREDLDYSELERKRHQYFQDLKKRKEAEILAGSSPVLPEPIKMIELDEKARRTFVTAMGKENFQIRNRELAAFVRQVGGYFVKTTEDIRIALPNFSPEATEPFLISKLHFKHSGKEEYREGTLRSLFGSAIKEAGLDKRIQVEGLNKPIKELGLKKIKE